MYGKIKTKKRETKTKETSISRMQTLLWEPQHKDDTHDLFLQQTSKILIVLIIWGGGGGVAFCLCGFCEEFLCGSFSEKDFRKVLK